MTDLNQLVFIRRGNALVGADLHTDEWLAKIKDGGEIVLRATKEKSSVQHRWFRGMVKKAHEHLPEDMAERFPTVENLTDAIKVATGWYEWQHLYFADGSDRRYQKPKSLSDMDFDKFNEWSKLATDILSSMIGIDATTLMKETGRAGNRR